VTTEYDRQRRTAAGRALLARRIFAWFVLSFASTGITLRSPPVAAAESTIVEVEPNDTPATANEVIAPAILLGTMAGQDQDAYNWIVSDEDAGKRWTIELHGIPGRLTILEVARIQYDDTGEVVAAERLFRMGTRDGSLPSVAAELMFEPGQYLLGVAQAGGNDAAFRPPEASLSFGQKNADDAAMMAREAGGYRVQLTAANKLPPGGDKEYSSRDSARPAPPGRELTAFLDDASSTWYRIDFKDAADASRWDIRVQVPVGRAVRASLMRAEGEQLSRATSDTRGALLLPDIALPAGSYYLEVEPVLKADQLPGFVQTLSVVAAGRRIDGAEAEPNDKWELANRVDLDHCCSGRIGASGDVDLFAFTLDEARAGQSH
jgi:hypothetical protein